MKWIGNIFIYFGLFLVYQGSIGNRSNFTFADFFLSLLLATPLLLIGTWLNGMHEEEQQQEADEGAEDILDNKDGESINFFLYLRPFDSTNAYKITDSHLNFFSWEIWERDGFDDIERLIARTLRPTANFVALGRPGEHRGAGRILATEEGWREELAELARKAKLIIIIPSYHSGTLWELQLLLEEGYLDKTIFVMPPGEGSVYSSGAQDVAKEWLATQVACQAMGLALPDFSSGGALFKIAAFDKSPTMLSLPRPDPVAWMKAIQALIDA